MKKTVILHIGHGKTGTSAIQSFLALNAARLEEMGVRYPDHASSEAARKGQVTLGNGDGKPDQLFTKIRKELQGGGQAPTLLFSSERLFGYREEILDAIQAERAKVNFEIIMFVRNPVDMAISAYHQAVKRGGETRPFEQCAGRATQLLEARNWHEDLEKAGIKSKVYNYSTRGTETIATFMKAIDCDAILAEQQNARAQHRTVNRSLTRMELNLVRAANRAHGAQAGWRLSDRLVQTSPDLAVHRMEVSDDLLERITERVGPAVDYFNAVLPTSDHLEIVRAPKEDGDGQDEDMDAQYASIAAAFNALQDAHDASIASSPLARKLDYWDYRVHRALGDLPFATKSFRRRFSQAADRRHRSYFD